MQTLITSNLKHLLYQDEAFSISGKEGDRHTFLLTNYCEVYRYTKSSLKVIFWRSPKFVLLQKQGVIFNDWATDDLLWLGEVKSADLGKVLTLGIPKRRIDAKGKKLKDLEEKLGHKIIPYNPKLD